MNDFLLTISLTAIVSLILILFIIFSGLYEKNKQENLKKDFYKKYNREVTKKDLIFAQKKLNNLSKKKILKNGNHSSDINDMLNYLILNDLFNNKKYNDFINSSNIDDNEDIDSYIKNLKNHHSDDYNFSDDSSDNDSGGDTSD